MRLIDADALIVELNKRHILYNVRINKAIMDAPTIDAVSVVRCRECRHKYQEPWNNGVAVEGECEIWHRATLGDDFCSYGERRASR